MLAIGVIGAVASVCDITAHVLSSIREIKKSENADVKKYVKKINTEYYLILIESTLRQLHKDIESHSSSSSDLEKREPSSEKRLGDTLKKLHEIDEWRHSFKVESDNPLEINLRYMVQSLKDIHHDLKDIERIMVKNEARLCHRFRSQSNLQRKLEDLKMNTELLRDRFGDFLKMNSSFLRKSQGM
jgi:hypothetical protein